MYLDVTIRGDVDKDEVIGQLQEVARKNFWQKTSSNDVKVNLRSTPRAESDDEVSGR
jgi:hypothetical protein